MLLGGSHLGSRLRQVPVLQTAATRRRNDFLVCNPPELSELPPRGLSRKPFRSVCKTLHAQEPSSMCARSFHVSSHCFSQSVAASVPPCLSGWTLAAGCFDRFTQRGEDLQKAEAAKVEHCPTSATASSGISPLPPWHLPLPLRSQDPSLSAG